MRDHLPPPEEQARRDLSGLPQAADWPEMMNSAARLLDPALGPGRPALHFPGPDGGFSTLTRGQLAERVAALAAVLVEDLGLIPGQRVLLRAPNTPMLATAWLAVLWAGGVAVATMPLLRAGELAHILGKARVNLALCDATLTDELAAAIDAAQVAGLEPPLLTHGSGAPDAAPAGQLDSLLAAALAAGRRLPPCPTRADDPALIAFTSGTTGPAKGTVHDHRDLAAIDALVPPRLELGCDDITLGSPPLAFTFGLGALLTFPLSVGASAVLLPAPSPEALLQALAATRATVLFTAPTAYRALAGLIEAGAPLAPPRLCVSAGEHLPGPDFERWRKLTGHSIVNGIGATELLHIFIAATGADARPGTTGRPIPGYRARLLDEAGQPVPPGQPGRLAIQGPTGCRYLADRARQRAYVHDGWNLTGDLFRMDEDGLFWYLGRADDMIISAGYNIGGPEVESCLLAHPLVEDCAVVGLPDPERGQVVAAHVILSDPAAAGPATARALQDFVKARLAPYKYPRRVLFVDRLPRTATGKLQRFRLRPTDTGDGP
ncbi:AMP-binding protein [Roseospirillum parvum]|uniref:2-aminobenzoate-CoA ligase n=1 Tax=Roseospirillum parvum TaxID=83401 RepID=A0A1G7WU07_9PROT|nr:AMP-binding protein [Roseospirillum parvum]SDG75403.1 2-aminobenzoate-CoA ligase [Roseospirillum parvum]